MNNWDLARANCTVPEETDDKSKNVNSGSGLFAGIGAYKKIGTHDLSYRQLIYTYYKQTTASFRKKLAQRGTNEFKKSFAYHDADDEIEEIVGTKKEKKKNKKAKVNKFARTLPPRIYAKFKKYRGIKIKRRKEESSDEEVGDDDEEEGEQSAVKGKEEEKEVEKNDASQTKKDNEGNDDQPAIDAN